MLSLPALSEKYKNLYPEYIDPLAKFSPGDPKLAAIKRQALSPYLGSLEEQRILYDHHILVSAFLFDIEVNENGFIAELWKIKTHQLPHYPYPFKERKKSDGKGRFGVQQRPVPAEGLPTSVARLP